MWWMETEYNPGPICAAGFTSLFVLCRSSSPPAAAAGHCQHETGAAASISGHHEHKHHQKIRPIRPMCHPSPSIWIVLPATLDRCRYGECCGPLRLTLLLCPDSLVSACTGLAAGNAAGTLTGPSPSDLAGGRQTIT